MKYYQVIIMRQRTAFKLLLFAGLLLVAGVAQAGTTPAYRSRATDSIWTVLRQTTLPDSQRVLTFISLEQEYYMNDNATALRLARQALVLARRHRFERGELMVLSDLSRINSALSELPQAERWAQELQRRAGEVSPALRRFRIVALQTHATVAVAQHDDMRALHLLRQALAMLPQIDPKGQFPLLSLLTYYGLSDMYTGRVVDEPHPADSLLRLARQYSGAFAAQARRYGREDFLAGAYISLGRLSYVAGNDSTAYYLSRAAALYHHNDFGAMEGNAHYIWARIALLKRQYPVAEAQAHQVIALALAIHDPLLEFEARDVLAEVLAATGRSGEAYRQAKRARELHDSTEQTSNYAQLQTLQVQFDTQRKASQIQALTQQQTVQQSRGHQQQQQIWFLGLALAIVVAGAAVGTRLALKLRRSQTLLATQHQQLTTQNEELSQTRATQDRLYALVAHDLRSPVVAFVGLADLLHRYVQRQDTTGLANLGGYIRQAAQNLSELLDNLLNWALNQRGELLAVPRSLRVATLLTEMADLYQHTADAADISLNIDTTTDLLVLADLNMTRAILRNITSNALKATPKGGQVTLRAWQETGDIQLQVTDTGAGFPPEVLHLFATDSARLRVADHVRGAGLGLLLSHAFAQAQGGKLQLANATTGTGVRVLLALPATRLLPTD